MIKFSTSSTAWQQIWQVTMKAESKQYNTNKKKIFFNKRSGGKTKFEMTEKFSFQSVVLTHE